MIDPERIDRLLDVLNRLAAGPPLAPGGGAWYCNALVRNPDGTYYRCGNPPSACSAVGHRPAWETVR